jgi:hypothetical protein
MSEENNTIVERIQNFKAAKFYFSFSSLTKLMLDPPAFYNDYVLKNRKDLSLKHLSV